jgi:glycosyltransferase involved in cell wall biosynthesis
MRPTPSVLLVTHYFPEHGGGIELVAGQVARKLGERGWRIAWYASDTDAPPKWDNVAVHPQPTCNVAERVAGLPLPIWSPASFAKLIRAVRASEVVHVHDVHYPANCVAALAALQLRKRLVVTQHVGFVPYRNASLRGILALSNRILGRLVLGRADAVLFVSPVVRSYFERLVGSRPTFANRANGVDSALFSPAAAGERMALRRALDLPIDRNVILFVGRHVEKKGLALLRALAGRTPEWTWCLIGDGPIDPSTWGLANVLALGRRSQEAIVDYYRAADVLVLPSVGEGFPLVVQEALSSGCPVAVHTESWQAGQLPEVAGIEESVDGGDATERWHRRLVALLSEHDEERQRRRLECRELAVQRWSWESAIDAYVSALSLGPTT